MNRKLLAAAFPVTVPVLMGYLAIGMAFGLMLQSIEIGRASCRERVYVLV